MLELIRKFRALSPQKRARITSTVSMIYNFLSGGVKIFLGIMSSYFFACVSGAYVLCIGMGKRIYFHGREVSEGETIKEIKYYKRIGIIIFIGAVCYIIAVMRYIIFFEQLSRYGMLTSIVLCSVSFVEITLAVMGIIRARRDKDLLMEGLKCINFVTSLVAIVTTEAVLLTWLEIGNASYVNGVSGLVFGVLSASVGIFIFVKAVKLNRKFGVTKFSAG